jgi:hypothetical protein
MWGGHCRLPLLPRPLRMRSSFALCNHTEQPRPLNKTHLCWVGFGLASKLNPRWPTSRRLGELSVFQRFAEVTQPGRRGSGRQEATPRPPGAGTRIALLQTALRRPLSKLMTRTTNPTTSNKWTRLPPTCRLKPRSHKIRRTTKMVQSMSPSCAHS